MNRRELITLLGGAAAWPVAARAQQPGPVRRIGVLMSGALDDLEIRLPVFRQALEKLGWTEKRNLHITSRAATGDDSKLRAAAAELVMDAPDVILVNGTQATAILKEQTRAIPIVFTGVADAVASGLVTNMARPAGNITGFTSVEYSLAGKWLSILKEIAPSITRVMALYYPDNSNWMGYLPTIETGAQLVGVTVTATAARTTDEIGHRIEAFSQQPGGGMIVLPSGLTVANRAEITGLSAHHLLPAVYPYPFFGVSGGLASYGSGPVDQYRQAASYVHRILLGERPGELPVQAPTKFELIINLRTARLLGLTVPPTVLALADEVIE
jgi:putative tryptophan/tyrosine transport system substrate-binding protein